MVVMALATTFMTVPLISVVYPPSMYAHKKLLSDKDGMGAHGAAAGSVTGSSSSQHLALPKRLGMEDVADGQEGPVKILLALPNMSSVRPMMSLMQMITSAVEVTALRLMPLGDRLGALLKVKESGETLRADPVLGMFKTFAQLNHIAIDSMIAIAPEHDFAEHIVNCAEENEINMIVLSHRPATVSDDAEHHDHQLSLPSLGSSAAQLAMERRSVIDKVCKTASCSVAVMLDRGFNVGENDVQVPANLLTVRSMNSLKVRSPVSGQASIYLPFVGGVDDREALLFALQFHKGVNMHIIILKVEEETAVKVTMLSEKQESSTETIQVEAVAEENRDNKLPQQHRSLTTDSVEADTDLLEILKEKVDANAAKSISSSSDGPSDVLSMATVSVPYGSEYASMMDWIRQRGLGRGDMVVIGRALYEKGKDASSLIQQKNHNAHFASQTVLERETGCSLCIVQHHSS